MFSSPARRSAPASTAGFTLIEVLVVLVLIGVIAGLATLSLGNGAERELRKVPFFVRAKARRNTEAYAAARGLAAIGVDTLYEAKAHHAR